MKQLYKYGVFLLSIGLCLPMIYYIVSLKRTDSANRKVISFFVTNFIEPQSRRGHNEIYTKQLMSKTHQYISQSDCVSINESVLLDLMMRDVLESRALPIINSCNEKMIDVNVRFLGANKFDLSLTFISDNGNLKLNDIKGFSRYFKYHRAIIDYKLKRPSEYK